MVEEIEVVGSILQSLVSSLKRCVKHKVLLQPIKTNGKNSISPCFLLLCWKGFKAESDWIVEESEVVGSNLHPLFLLMGYVMSSSSIHISIPPPLPLPLIREIKETKEREKREEDWGRERGREREQNCNIELVSVKLHHHVWYVGDSTKRYTSSSNV